MVILHLVDRSLGALALAVTDTSFEEAILMSMLLFQLIVRFVIKPGFYRINIVNCFLIKSEFVVHQHIRVQEFFEFTDCSVVLLTLLLAELLDVLGFGLVLPRGPFDAGICIFVSIPRLTANHYLLLITFGRYKCDILVLGEDWLGHLLGVCSFLVIDVVARNLTLARLTGSPLCHTDITFCWPISLTRASVINGQLLLLQFYIVHYF